MYYKGGCIEHCTHNSFVMMLTSLCFWQRSWPVVTFCLWPPVPLCPVLGWKAWWGEDVRPPDPSGQVPRPRDSHPAHPEDRQHPDGQTRCLGKLCLQVKVYVVLQSRAGLLQLFLELYWGCGLSFPPSTNTPHSTNQMIRFWSSV